MGAPAHPHQQALAGFPRTLDPVRAHVVAELPVHALRGKAEGHLTQDGEISHAEKALDRAARTIGGVDFSLG